ncbi:hypothetical protein GGS21DRAFT_518243 [Xylaria nigripes]|nr:hypothetical protein GGS21DRAFT_518243 [Xylaria nigripes]
MAKKRNHQKADKRARPGGSYRTFGTASIYRFADAHGYTLADEARNTASKRRGFSAPDAKLRHKPVIFVSAGFIDPLKAFEIAEQRPILNPAGDAVPSTDVADDLTQNPVVSAPSCTQSSEVDGAAHYPPVPPSDNHLDDLSDPESDSSVEIILFKGRSAENEQKQTALPKKINDKGDKSHSTKPPNVNLQLRLGKKAVRVTVNSDSASQADKSDYIPLDTKKTRKQPSRKSRSNKHSDDDNDEAAIIADYIANMRDDSSNGEEDEQKNDYPVLGSNGFSITRDLGGTDSDAVPSPTSSGGDSENELDNAVAEESEGGTEGEACQLESEDARLAQSIAKREELGLGDDDVPSSDGADPDDGWVVASSANRRRRGRRSKRSQKSRLFESGSQFPSATKMAQAFDELDLMDMQNALRQPIGFNVSDSELEYALNTSFKKDRLKKAEKKKAREELRSQGLLNKNADPRDLRVKYQNGLTREELVNEIDTFLRSTDEQLIIPPLDKMARKVVHKVAHVFHMTSKSVGVGRSRYTFLYRTKATRPSDRGLIEKNLGRTGRPWFPRVDVGKNSEAAELDTDKPGTNTSRSKRALTFREGDIVGKDAAELGIENKGRAMLEKMGWIKGMALGNEGSNGLIVPLTLVVKKTKAGLGEA